MASSSSNVVEPTDSEISQGSLLVLVVDVNPDQRAFLCKPVRRLTQWLDSGLALVNSHLLLHPANEVAVVAASKRSCRFLYPDVSQRNSTSSEQSIKTSSAHDGQFEGFEEIENIIRKRAHSMIVGEMQEPGQPFVAPDSLITGGLCMALSYINRRHKDTELNTLSAKASKDEGSDKHASALNKETHGSQNALRSRILVMTASGSTSAQYMSYMNAFFTAQVRQVERGNWLQ